MHAESHYLQCWLRPVLNLPAQLASSFAHSWSNLRFSSKDLGVKRMREQSPLLLLLFRTAYLYTMILYAACMALGFPGSLVGLAVTVGLAVCAETKLLWDTEKDARDGMEIRYMV